MVARLTAEADQAPGHVEKKGVIDQLTVSLPILWRLNIPVSSHHMLKTSESVRTTAGSIGPPVSEHRALSKDTLDIGGLLV
ncbi:hypothetical protein VTN49DRAFT_345 [Thermomyces lanuginosus]|uniref:uncharacterized protein n=1 Tax=Thermomyces lanuginosus TaxID=5541 RepID=UPI0037446C22